MKQQINGQKGWYNIVFDRLLNDIQRLIKSGLEPQAALNRCFSESCASKTIKAKIEHIILGN